MNADIKKEWIEALRSGKYRQTKGTLQDEDGYCCLGVLCDIAHRHGVGEWNGDPDLEPTFFRVGDVHDSALIPEGVIEWAEIPATGIDSGSGALHGLGSVYNITVSGHGPLATLNDTGKSFSIIADLIEEHL